MSKDNKAEDWWRGRQAELRISAPGFWEFASVEIENQPGFNGSWRDLLVPYILRLEKENKDLLEEKKDLWERLERLGGWEGGTTHHE